MQTCLRNCRRIPELSTFILEGFHFFRKTFRKKPSALRLRRAANVSQKGVPNRGINFKHTYHAVNNLAECSYCTPEVLWHVSTAAVRKEHLPPCLVSIPKQSVPDFNSDIASSHVLRDSKPIRVFASVVCAFIIRRVNEHSLGYMKMLLLHIL